MELNRFSRHRAFSLVEITIALGIFAFVLVSMLGLMGASISAERTADFDTVVSRMAQNTNAWVKNEGFDAVLAKSDSTYRLSDAEVDFYFEDDGSLIRMVDGSPNISSPAPASAAFSGRVQVNRGSTAARPTTIRIRFDFHWLKATTSAKQYNWTFQTTMADYE